MEGREDRYDVNCPMDIRTILHRHSRCHRAPCVRVRAVQRDVAPTAPARSPPTGSACTRGVRFAGSRSVQWGPAASRDSDAYRPVPRSSARLCPSRGPFKTVALE